MAVSCWCVGHVTVCWSCDSVLVMWQCVGHVTVMWQCVGHVTVCWSCDSVLVMWQCVGHVMQTERSLRIAWVTKIGDGRLTLTPSRNVEMRLRKDMRVWWRWCQSVSRWTVRGQPNSARLPFSRDV